LESRKIIEPENFLLFVTFAVICPLTLKSFRHLLYVLSENASKEYLSKPGRLHLLASLIKWKYVMRIAMQKK